MTSSDPSPHFALQAGLLSFIIAHMKKMFARGTNPRLLSRLNVRAAGALFCAAALLLSSRLCFADPTCPDDTEVSHTNEEILDPAYQPPPPDDTRGILRRVRFVPPGDWPVNKKFPAVLMFPPDVFHLGYSDQGNPGERVASHDLQFAGFLVFQVNHRLAPPGHLTGQHTSGIAPAQTDDAEGQILAALADPQCNGTIYLVGGSAGGCLALWCALDSATHTATGWNNDARLHIKAVVSFSGPTNLDDWSHPDLPDYTQFETAVDNYVGLTYPDHTDGPLLAASPVNLITTGVATSSPPVILVGSQFDTVSHTQQDDMKNALNSIHASVTYYYFPESDNHAYDNWHVLDPTGNNCVSADVINFLRSNP